MPLRPAEARKRVAHPRQGRTVGAFGAAMATPLAPSVLLVTGGEITGILDWETARVDHPFWDFDLGEWGTGLWRQQRAGFSKLWATAWREYAGVRGIDPDPAPLETAFRLRQALALLDGDGPSDPAVAGTVEEHLAPIC
jgi:hypothetical protein